MFHKEMQRDVEVVLDGRVSAYVGGTVGYEGTITIKYDDHSVSLPANRIPDLMTALNRTIYAATEQVAMAVKNGIVK